MKALFLVGGSGTRLRPFTNYLPKPMIPVMGRPLLERTCERLVDCGVEQVVMNPCYMPHTIMEHFGDGRKFGMDVAYELEMAPLGTGGTIRNTGHHYDDTFFVFNADILHDVDLEDMMDFHKKMKADVTIAATWVEDPTPYGSISYTSDGLVTEFKEKPKPQEVSSHYINAGIYIFEPSVLGFIPGGGPVSVEREVFPTLLAAGRPVAVYRDSGYWMDIGTPEKYVQAHRDIFAGSCGIGEADFRRDDVVIDRTAAVAHSAMMDNMVFVGRFAEVGAHCILGDHVVVGDGAEIAHNCYLEDAIIWPGTHVPAGQMLRHCIATRQNGKLVRFPYESFAIPSKGSYAGHERH